MKQYEYKVVEKRILIERMLNKLAKEGWELINIVPAGLVAGVSIGTDKYIFKREV